MPYPISRRVETQTAPRSVLKPKPALQNRKALPFKSNLLPQPEPKVMISTKPILQSKPRKLVYGTKKSHAHRRPREPDHPLFLDYQSAVENSRTTLLTTAEQGLSNIYHDLTARVSTIKAEHDATKDRTISQLSIILAPLEDEEVETKISQNGVQSVEIRRLGDSVAELRSLLDTQEKVIENAWKEWRGVQQELVALGKDVLGEEIFESSKTNGAETEVVHYDGKKNSGGNNESFKRNMELWNTEKVAKLEEFKAEIEETGELMIEKLAASEKECNARQKNEQLAFLASLWE